MRVRHPIYFASVLLQLWIFLQSGGFAAHNNVVRNVLGRDPRSMWDLVRDAWAKTT